jgi:CHAT domain-containing protein/tetratricopeptide (TPR) repeat protein
LLRAEVVEELADAVVKYVRVDMGEALRLAEGALAIAQAVGDDNALARGFRAKANALHVLGQNQTAVELHERAIAIYAKLGDATELGRSLSASIQPLALLGLYDRAYANVARALHIFRAQGDSLRLARLEINFGNVLHRQDRFTEALDAYRRACDELWPDKDVEGIAVALHNIAVCLIALNDYHEAVATYRRAREFCEQHGMPLLVRQSDYNIAYLYYLRGEYGRAIDSLRSTREVSQETGDHHHFALCYLDLSEIYLELNLSEEAAQMAQEAVKLFEKLGTGYEAAKSLVNHAIALGQQEKASEALELFSKARELFVKEGNHVWPSLIDLYEAVVYFNQGRSLEAHRLCEAAHEFFRASVLPTKAIICRLLLARLALKTGDLECARDHCETAAEQANQLESPILQYQTKFVLGQVHEAMGQPTLAYADYETAHREMEALRSSLVNEEMKIAFMANRLEVYERLVELSLDGVSAPDAGGCHPASPSEQAFLYVEHAKSRSLRDLVFGRMHCLTRQEAGRDEFVRRIRDLREQLNWYYHRIELEQLGRSGTSVDRLRRLEEQARMREEQLLRALREQPAGGFPEAVEASRVSTLAEIRAALPAAGTLIEYFQVGDRLFVAVLDQESLEVVTLNSLSKVTSHLRMLQFQLAKPGQAPAYLVATGGATLPPAQRHLRLLYEELVAPVQDRLKGDRLVIVPHDALHYVPFHALFDGQHYLIDLFATTYAPSASILALCHRAAARSWGPSLVMGLPDSQAPLIGDEVVAVAGLLPESALYLGEHATSAVLREKGAVSRFIHIATHGHFRHDNPLFSGVRLGDGNVQLYDLYHLSLPAELIALSGCATGLNVTARGDELLGLQRGLLYAGAKSLLLTMWEVNDQSTAQFMRMFYQGLLEGADRAKALQSAAIRLREQYPHPYYWAPFVLIGDALGGLKKIVPPAHITGSAG